MDRKMCVIAFLAILLAIPVSPSAQTSSENPQQIKCRDSRFPPVNEWPKDEELIYRLRRVIDVDNDGHTDILVAEDSSGSSGGLTTATIVFAAREESIEVSWEDSFSDIVQVAPIPAKLLEPRHEHTLDLIEEVLFRKICWNVDPSLSWLLAEKKRIRYYRGRPILPETYAVRMPASSVPKRLLPETQEICGEVWLCYGGHNHRYRGLGREQAPVELARDGTRVLLGTPHGVILTDTLQSRYAWIYVSHGGYKLRWPSVLAAQIEGEKAKIRVRSGFFDEEQLVFVDLRTGSVR